MTPTELIWELHWGGISYLSWLVKDIIGLVIERISYSLAGAPTDQILDALRVEVFMDGQDLPDREVLYLYQTEEGEIISFNHDYWQTAYYRNETTGEDLLTHRIHGLMDSTEIQTLNEAIYYQNHLTAYHFDFRTLQLTSSPLIPGFTYFPNQIGDVRFFDHGSVLELQGRHLGEWQTIRQIVPSHIAVKIGDQITHQGWLVYSRAHECYLVYYWSVNHQNITYYVFYN